MSHLQKTVTSLNPHDDIH